MAAINATGLNMSLLSPKTKLFVETTNSFYEIVIVEAKQIEIFGGTLKDGGIRFPRPVQAIFYGSTWGGSMIKVDWLGIGMLMEFKAENADKPVRTSLVRKIRIESADGNWNFTISP